MEENKIISVNGRVVSLGYGSVALPVDGTTLFSHELELVYDNEWNENDYAEYKVILVSANPVPFENFEQLYAFLEEKHYLVVPTQNDEYLKPVVYLIYSNGSETYPEIYIRGYAFNPSGDGEGYINVDSPVNVVKSDTVTPF